MIKGLTGVFTSKIIVKGNDIITKKILSESKTYTFDEITGFGYNFYGIYIGDEFYLKRGREIIFTIDIRADNLDRFKLDLKRHNIPDLTPPKDYEKHGYNVDNKENDDSLKEM